MGKARIGSMVCIVALSAVAVVAPGPWKGSAADQDPYHILVTNDDGIESPWIEALAEALEEVGEVTVVAPCGQRSGSSMAVALGQEINLREVRRGALEVGSCVDATPAGAVLFALAALAPEGGFDLVVSGINQGANVGDVSHMSGTVGAAMAGAYRGVPAIAASLDPPGGPDYAAGFVVRFVRAMRERPPEPGIVYSINFPHADETDIRGVAVRPMGGSLLEIEYVEGDPTDEGRTFSPRFRQPDPPPAGSDLATFREGYITITPLRFDWTAHDLIDEVAAWDLEHTSGGDR